mgnify:CR=1 FL=1
MDISTIFCGSDHAGLSLKKLCIHHLKALGWGCTDVGTDSTASCDYPLFAAKVCREVLEHDQLGLLVCGTGLGMSMTANRFPFIRAALCTNELMARMARKHNKANILCLGSRIIGEDLALGIVDAFVHTDFEHGRHQKRIDLMEEVAP